MCKDLPMMLEKAVKKEMAAAEPAVVRSITLAIEKTTITAIVVPFQRVVAEKAVNQLEKSANTKPEAAVARQIQAQLTCGKQAHQVLIIKFDLDFMIFSEFILLMVDRRTKHNHPNTRWV